MKKEWVMAALLLLPVGAYAFQAGDVVPEAILTQLAADKSKVTVVDFFAEWCASCRKELPLLAQANTQVDSQKVEFVGIDTDASPSVAEAFQQEMKAKGALNFRVVNDPKQQLVQQFKPRGYPALYLLKDGKVAKVHLGAMPDIDKVIAQDLQGLSP